VGDADGLEELGAGRVVVAAEEEKLGENLGGERRVVGARPPRPGRRAVAADAADLPFLVLVIVPADPARVLPLPLPHLRRPRRRSSGERGSQRADRAGWKWKGAAVPFPEGGSADWIGWCGEAKRQKHRLEIL
jgi:hypothetical protein